MMTPLELEARLDRLTTQVMVPLRTEKTVAAAQITELCELIESSRLEGLFKGSIDVGLAGKLWWLFCAMLAEADHAKDPNQILDAAWK